MSKTKKILIIFLATLGMAFAQSKIIRVSAQVDRIAFMGPDADFGIVFPQENLQKDFYIQAASGYTNPISYRLATLIKPKGDATTEYCLINPLDYDHCYRLLCPYLNVLSNEGEGDTKDSSSLNTAGDTTDYWKIGLDVPTIDGYIGQDFTGTPIDSEGDYGCDVKMVIMGSGHDPIVKAKWEMTSDKDQTNQYLGTDDSSTSGAQFTPSAQYQTPKKITVCGIVTDSDGLDDINAVYASVFYPTGVFLGPSHESGNQGCGALKQEGQLFPLSKAEGIELFCNRIRANNNNLPIFNNEQDYSEICDADGELMKETAAVYCGERNLSYEDPSGDYRTVVLAQDKYGLSTVLENYFQYLPLAAFETDFTSVNYGSAKLNTEKVINGDLVFGTNENPTIRNIGNTRLNMGVWQDDMGFGNGASNWHVSYDSRIGGEAEFKDYDPETLTSLNDFLNLSDTEEMDFSVKVSKFKEGQDNYIGNMTLSAETVPHLICQ